MGEDCADEREEAEVSNEIDECCWPGDVVQWVGGTGQVVSMCRADRVVVLRGGERKPFDELDLVFRGTWPDNLLDEAQVMARNAYFADKDTCK